MATRRGSGFGAYFFPMLSFLLLVEASTRASESVRPLFLPLKVLVPFGLLLYFARRGAYPELRGYRATPRGVCLDVLVGLLGAALWMAPYLLLPGLKDWPPEWLGGGAKPGFDPLQLGERWVWLALALRGFGYAVVTPFVEELFVRSWLIRYIDVFDKRQDFRDAPIARFAWRSFLVVVVYFVLSHVPWEYPVMLAWTLLTMAWYYHRRHLVPIVIAHATTNLAIFLAVLLGSGRFTDAQGASLSLWFFV